MPLPAGALVVNPGSVGLPGSDDDVPHPHVMGAASPYARYTDVDDATGRWEVDFRSVDHDWEQAARVAEDNGRRNALVAAGLLVLTAAGVALAARLRRRCTTGRGGSR